ncbi:hypothetical protein GCM10022244_54130 [Streptomyces gulbargensis]|uniref:Integral membrane protein n=1 Tax=Streptomyces gulbargensis TaxID=364901 RepID=A0ABP7N9M7_9ACTN
MSGTAHTCPGCGRDDRVQAVPAVHLAGRDAVTRRERGRNGAPRTVTRTVTTGLSDALAPVPRPPSYAIGGLGFLAGAVSAAAYLLGGALEEAGEPTGPEGWNLLPGEASAGSHAAEVSTVTGWTSIAALCVALLVLVELWRRRATHARLTRGRDRAEELWSRGWYCHRCGTVHLVGAPGEDRTPLSLQQFREKVWTQGGYGAVAARQRAVDPGRR